MASLHEAAKEGNLAEVERLLSKGVNVNYKDEYDKTPLHLVAIQGCTEVAKLFVWRGADINTRDRYGNNL